MISVPIIITVLLFVFVGLLVPKRSNSKLDDMVRKGIMLAGASAAFTLSLVVWAIYFIL